MNECMNDDEEEEKKLHHHLIGSFIDISFQFFSELQLSWDVSVFIGGVSCSMGLSEALRGSQRLSEAF